MIEEKAAEEYIPTERVGVVVWLLGRGHKFTTLEVSRIAGITPRGALMMMDKLCRVLPMTRDGAIWMMVDEEAGEA